MSALPITSRGSVGRERADGGVGSGVNVDGLDVAAGLQRQQEADIAQALDDTAQRDEQDRGDTVLNEDGARSQSVVVHRPVDESSEHAERGQDPEDNDERRLRLEELHIDPKILHDTELRLRKGLRVQYSPEALLNEAREWIGTPYHHAADVKSTPDKRGGVDCAMLLVRVFCDTRHVPMFDPRPYPPDWHLHRDQERFLSWIDCFTVPVESPEPGDVALFQYGRCVSHGGIMETPDIIIHADLDARIVERCQLDRLKPRLRGFRRLTL